MFTAASGQGVRSAEVGLEVLEESERAVAWRSVTGREGIDAKRVNDRHCEGHLVGIASAEAWDGGGGGDDDGLHRHPRVPTLAQLLFGYGQYCWTERRDWSDHEGDSVQAL